MLRRACALVEKGPDMTTWDRYAVVVQEDGYPRQIRNIEEAACHALGAFTTGQHFNINIFDSAVFHKNASDLDIVRGCMAVWLESYTNNADGTPKKLPGVQDLRAWEDRFGDAFGGNYKGKSIVDVVYGRTRKNITTLLPNPDPQAFHTTPPQEVFPELGGELAAGIKKRQRDWTEKPSTLR